MARLTRALYQVEHTLICAAGLTAAAAAEPLGPGPRSAVPVLPFPVSADDMDRLAMVAAAVADRMRADARADSHDEPTLFAREVA